MDGIGQGEAVLGQRAAQVVGAAFDVLLRQLLVYKRAKNPKYKNKRDAGLGEL